MREKQIVICDTEADYAKRFAEFANSHRESLFAVHGFTDCGKLQAYIKEHPVDILLLSEECLEQFPEGESTGKIILLSEEEYRNRNTWPAVYKFQPCSEILRQAVNLYAEQATVSLGVSLRAERMKRIGIYSPVGRTGKTSFALALGKEIAKKKRTLYLNMEEYSGFSVLYPDGEEWTLSELMYFLKQGKKAFACKLESVIQKMGNLDYIPPLRSPVEMRHISVEDWNALLNALERESRYELVILDLSGAVNGLFEILDQCDYIYMPGEEDEAARAKMSQYEDTLKLLSLECIMERTEKLRLKEKTDFEGLVRSEGRRWSES